MAIVKFHKDLLNEQPDLLSYVLGQFDKDPLDVTTIQDVIDNYEAWLVRGKHIPHSGTLLVTMVTFGDIDLPPDAHQFKGLYNHKYTGYWQHYN